MCTGPSSPVSHRICPKPLPLLPGVGQQVRAALGLSDLHPTIPSSSEGVGVEPSTPKSTARFQPSPVTCPPGYTSVPTAMVLSTAVCTQQGTPALAWVPTSTGFKAPGGNPKVQARLRLGSCSYAEEILKRQHFLQCFPPEQRSLNASCPTAYPHHLCPR